MVLFSILIAAPLTVAVSSMSGARMPLLSARSTRSVVASDALAFEEEVSRRRNLAIISHPDAGKTTLTEKLLLRRSNCIGRCCQGQGEQRRMTPDFMAIEQERRYLNQLDCALIRIQRQV